jgi:hypothetical protein
LNIRRRVGPSNTLQLRQQELMPQRRNLAA